MKKVIGIIFMLLVCFQGYSQDKSLADGGAKQKSKQVEIYFDLNSYVIDSCFQNNRENLTKLSDLITQLQSDDLITISSIIINSYASPDGGRYYNQQITEKRTNSIYDYLTKTTSVPDSLIEKRHSGIDWDGLYNLVERSDMEYREDILDIIKNTPEETWRRVDPTDKWMTLVDSRNKQLMELRYGIPYRYISKRFFPQLRMGSVVTIYSKSIAQPISKEIVEAVKTDSTKFAVIESVSEPIDEEEEVVEPIETIADNSDATEKKPIRFALKTNLLYDLLLIPSFEAEVPIGERWSIAGEWIFPWWITKDNGNALQILSGQVEGRYWFGSRTNKPQLTGWFAGFYAGGGLYDLQRKNNGYQGEFYIAAGASAGYAHTINKSGSLRMEYSLGFGYLNTAYRYYEGMQNNEYLVWQYDGRYTWIGPTKAKVSLVWFLDWKRGGKR